MCQMQKNGIHKLYKSFNLVESEGFRWYFPPVVVVQMFFMCRDDPYRSLYFLGITVVCISWAFASFMAAKVSMGLQLDADGPVIAQMASSNPPDTPQEIFWVHQFFHLEREQSKGGRRGEYLLYYRDLQTVHVINGILSKVIKCNLVLRAPAR